MPVIVYSKNNCPACAKAKALLDNLGISYEVKMVDRDMDAMDFMVERNHRTMPQIYKDGEVVVEGGYAGLEKMSAEEIYTKLK